MKFREKTYLVTLLLFLTVLNTGIFMLAFYTYKTSVDAAENVCFAEERVIAEAVADDLAYLKEGASEQLVFLSYGSFYKEKDVLLAFYREDRQLYSSLPEGVSVPAVGYSKTQRIEQKRYFLIAEQSEESDLIVVYAKDIGYLDKDFQRMAFIYIPTSVLASALLAVCLFFALRRLASPLEKLRTVSSEIASGNFSVRADDKGKDEFAMLARDFNRMAEHVETHTQALEQGNRVKQQMLDNLAHELRTPLTSIRGYAEFVQNANISEEEKWEALNYIISETERLGKISERLLDEAFIRENGIKKQTVSVSGLISDTVAALRAKAANEGVVLLEMSRDAVCACDPVLTGMLLSNLTDNAIKACRGVPNATVTVGCETDTDGGLYLFVRDNGVGMTAEQLAHVTEPFYRTDKSRSRSEGGTGLGLSLCARIVASHGWTMRFFSEPQKGSEVRILLPKEQNFTTP